MRRSKPELVWTARERIRIRREKQSHFLWFMSFFVCFGGTAPQRATAFSFTRFLDHTQRRTTFHRIPMDEWSARRRDLYLTTHNTHCRHISMPSMGFEPIISAGERPKNNALDRAATGIGSCLSYGQKLNICFGRAARGEDFGKWRVTWDVANSTIMRKWEWRFTNGCDCRRLISTSTKCLNLRLDGIDTSLCPRVFIWN